MPDDHPAVLAELTRRIAVRTKSSGDDETFVTSRSKSSNAAKAKGKGSGKTGKTGKTKKGGGEDGLPKESSGKWQQLHQQLAEQRDPANVDGRFFFFRIGLVAI